MTAPAGIRIEDLRSELAGAQPAWTHLGEISAQDRRRARDIPNRAAALARAPREGEQLKIATAPLRQAAQRLRNDLNAAGPADTEVDRALADLAVVTHGRWDGVCVGGQRRMGMWNDGRRELLALLDDSALYEVVLPGGRYTATLLMRSSDADLDSDVNLPGQRPDGLSDASWFGVTDGGQVRALP